VGQRGAPEASEPVEVEPTPVVSALRPDLEKTPLAYHSDYWLQLGERARSRIQLVGPRRIPALVIASGLAVTAPRVADGEVESPFKLLNAGAASALALLEIASPAPQAFALAGRDSLHPGLLVAAVSLDADGGLLVAPGTLASVPPPPGDEAALGEADSLEVSIPFPRSLTAAAIVDLDGNLVGAAFDAGGTLRLLSSETIVRLVDRLQRQPFCHAIEVAAIDERVKELLGVTGGVLVERVRAASFLPAPSIREGDVLLEWGGRKIADPDEFRRSYEAPARGEPVGFEVRRGRRPVRGVTVMPGPDCRPTARTPLPLSKLGMAIVPSDDLEGGLDVVSLSAGGFAAGAGIEIGDRIVEINGVPAGQAGLSLLRDSERRPRSLAILLRRDGRVRLVALSPDDQ
jgi:S1-C subfamily serine protease